MPARPERLILIHGAWAGAWVWDALIPELGALGRSAMALDLPGDGAHPIAATDTTETDFHTCLDAAILSAPGPVALVGHSGGGMLVTAGAARHPGRVSQGIWIAGMLIPDGRSFDDICAQAMGAGQRVGVTPHIRQAPDGRSSTVPPDAAIAHFFDDFPPTLAAEAAARLTPQPTAGHRMSTRTGPAFAELPKLYILATADKSVLPQVQRMMCKGVPNLSVQDVAAGHVPQVTQAPGLARIIDDWLPR